jgi:hypothetical protein
LLDFQGQKLQGQLDGVGKEGGIVGARKSSIKKLEWKISLEKTSFQLF